MKQLHHIFVSVFMAALLSLTTKAQTNNYETKWHWEKGTIVLDTPQRPAGQMNALQMTVPKIETVRVAFVGLGMRGPGAVVRFCHIPGVQIMALCDYEEVRAENCQKFLRQAGLPPADIYSGEKGYEELCKRSDIDLVYIATDWDHHFPVAKCALENYKNVAIEVPASMKLEQIWQLIDLTETKRKHCIMLENCCYDYFEMNALNMAQHGVFGEIMHAEGAYLHASNSAAGWRKSWYNPDGSDPDKLHWRLKYISEHRGDLYPTHGLGLVAQVMNIHRGDRFTKLVAMDTKSVMGTQRASELTGRDFKGFRDGDHTTTLLNTEAGKVVEIQFTVMIPQPYSRIYHLMGTKGTAVKYPEEKLFLTKDQMGVVGTKEMAERNVDGNYMSKEDRDALMKKYYHPILTKYGELGRNMGHGGMDFIMDSRLVYCLQNGLPMDIDVYDLAEWCALTELGAISLENGNASVSFPDFTRGFWNQQKGFRHAYATPADEVATETAAKASTENLKQLTIKKKLWEKYDKVQARKKK